MNRKGLAVSVPLLLTPVLFLFFAAILWSRPVQAESGAWTQIDDPHYIRGGHTATLLHDGRVLLVGGVRNLGRPDETEFYDPAAGVWTLSDSLNLYGHTAEMLRDGRVLVAGGLKVLPDNSSIYESVTQIYNPLSDNWVLTGSMNDPRIRHTSTMLQDGRILVAGGSNSTAVLTTSEIYDPASETWSLTEGMITKRDKHAAV
ncbi:MAG: Kelch repeat-containing protein, partial [Candidatus Promineifilaceae bacterium]